MQLTSSAINIRFSLNRDAAPENVKATIKPKRAKTAPSIVPRPPRSPSDSFGRRLTPTRRPISSKSNIPMRRTKAKSSGGMGGSTRGGPNISPVDSWDTQNVSEENKMSRLKTSDEPTDLFDGYCGYLIGSSLSPPGPASRNYLD